MRPPRDLVGADRAWRRTSTGKATLAAAALVTTTLTSPLLLRCGTEDAATGPGSDSNARDYSAVCGCCHDSTDLVDLHITYPEPGDALRVGDTVFLGFCTENPADVEDMKGSRVRIRIYGRTPWVEISEGIEYQFPWVVPESLDARGSMVSAVSESCQLRIDHYQEVDNFDTTAGFFTIRN